MSKDGSLKLVQADVLPLTVTRWRLGIDNSFEGRVEARFTRECITSDPSASSVYCSCNFSVLDLDTIVFRQITDDSFRGKLKSKVSKSQLRYLRF